MTFLALDLGAESGRAISGAWDGSRLELEPVHRFANRPVFIRDSLHWDVLSLYAGLEEGLAAHVRRGAELRSIGIDTWGVDFALLAPDDTLVGQPYHYRDHRTDGMFAKAFQRLSREEIFGLTGLQFLQFNTLYQLLAMQDTGASALQSAATLLLMPDLFNFWLSGEKRSEWTVASTSQLCDPRSRTWSKPLLDAFGLPAGILPPIVEPGTVLGPLLRSVAERVGLSGSPVQVVTPASHDTGSAVVAVPATTPHFGYISSGTWSLVGTEMAAPVLGEAALRYNFTNEGGVDNTSRLLKNIGGLWLVQECRRIWQRDGRERSYAELAAAAERAPAFRALVDPNHHDFLAPSDMPRAIRARCRATGELVPEDEGSTVRCALESLALAYRRTFEELAEVTGRPVDTIHIVGGGAQNRLLCQFTANACGLPVVAGPVEATALGNLLVQMMADGILHGLADARDVVRRSTVVEYYEPRDRDIWDEAYDRYQRIIADESE